ARTVDVDGVVARRRVKGRVSRRERAGDRECVRARPEPDVQPAEVDVADRDLELEAAQRVAGQRAALAVRRRIRIVDIEGVRRPRAATVYGEQGVDRVDVARRYRRAARERGGRASHVDRIVVRAAVHGDGTVHGEHIEYVVACISIERRRAAQAGGIDVDRV